MTLKALPLHLINRNILHVITRELNADFNASVFDHVAFFNEEKEQVEMHLKAKQRTAVEIKNLNLSVEFEKGETIHTEISR
jgi:L-histidine N-alpha-methyltransferase